MNETNVNTIVTIISIVLTVLTVSGIALKDRLFPRLWRKKYIKEHNPTPHFDLEMDMRLKGGGIYIQPKIQLEDKGKKKVVKLLRDYFFDEIFVEKGAKQEDKVFCILGDTGMGKTAALVNFFVDYIEHYKKSTLPFDIWLYSLGDQDVFEKIKAIENKGKSILLLDAVDENNDAKDDNGYVGFLKKLEQAYQDFAFVVTTCRPQFFGDEAEVFNATQAKRNGFFLKCKRLDLVPFDDNQVREYLFNLYYHEPNQKLKQEADRIVKKCSQISQRPLVLSFIKELVDDNDRNYENTLDIYDTIVTSLIRREVEKTSSNADKNMMRQWRDLLSEVAGFMYKNKKLSISKEEYEGILSEHNLKTTEDKKTFRQRSLLTRTAEGFQFSHKSFYEYFMAYRFFSYYSEIASVRDMDFTIQLFDELYLAYKSGKGSKHFGIDLVTLEKVAISLSQIGYGLQSLFFILEAERFYQKAINVFRQLANKSISPNLQYAETLNNLGNLHRITGHREEAEKEYEEALIIFRQLENVRTKNLHLPKMAATLYNFAVLRIKQGNYPDAEQMAVESMKIYQSLLEHNAAFKKNKPIIVSKIDVDRVNDLLLWLKQRRQRKNNFL